MEQKIEEITKSPQKLPQRLNFGLLVCYKLWSVKSYFCHLKSKSN